MPEQRLIDIGITQGDDIAPVGALIVWGRGDRVTSTFAYDAGYIYDQGGFELAPSVPLDDDRHTFRDIPLFLQDAGPDRWGAHLLDREARRTSPLRPLDRLDHITLANDVSRQGALRLTDATTGELLSDLPIPAQVTLAELLESSEEVVDDTESFAPFAKLLGVGTAALGGARPKASVIDEQGGLRIAKFPMRGDRVNVPAWEKVALDLAQASGIEVPANELVRVAGRDVLLLQRFDRADGTRLPYLSFRSLLNNPDDGSQPPDYLTIAAVLGHRTGAPREDLFRRVAFSVLINNTDDHLRNMGLIRRDGQWLPSPAFDLNPEPEAGAPRHTAVAGRYTHVGMAEALLRLGKVCGLGPDGVRAHILEIHDVVGSLGEPATALGISEREIGRMRSALDTVQAHVIADLRAQRSK